MRFWDSSAITPLILFEEETAYCTSAFRTDHQIMVWTMSKVEVLSALCRRHRENNLDLVEFEDAKKRMDDLFNITYEVTSIAQVKQRAMRLLHVHPLRAADALQLAAALVATQEDPPKMALISFDHRLNEAAKKEGFIVNPDYQ